MARKTSGTTWVVPFIDGKPALQAFRGTFLDNGDFVRADAPRPIFEPGTAKYLTSDHVDNVVAKGHVRIDGDTCSSARLLSVAGLHSWKQAMDLEGLKAHKYLGRTMPAVETIVAFHVIDEVESEF